MQITAEMLSGKDKTFRILSDFGYFIVSRLKRKVRQILKDKLAK